MKADFEKWIYKKYEGQPPPIDKGLWQDAEEFAEDFAKQAFDAGRKYGKGQKDISVFNEVGITVRNGNPDFNEWINQKFNQDGS